MKPLLLLLCSVFVSSAQLAITNNVKVQLTTNDDNALRLAWKLDSNARTNGLSPYVTATNALTYGQWSDWQATDAFHVLSELKANDNASEVLRLYRLASDADRAKAARILSGLSN